MIKKISLIILCFGICLLFTGCDKLTLTKGQTFSRKVKIVSKFNMSIFNNVDDKTAEMVVACEVTDIDNSGNAIVRATVDKIEAKIVTMGYLFQFSTDKPELNTKESTRPELQEKYVNIFSPLVGKSYTAVVDKDARVIELKDIDPAILKYAKAVTDDKISGKNQAILLLSETMLKEYVSPGIYNGTPEDNGSGEKTVASDIVAPSLPVIPVTRKVVEAGKMAASTAKWPEGTVKVYYATSADKLPEKFSSDEVVPVIYDNYKSATHAAVALWGNGCVGYSKSGDFVKMVERTFIEVSSNRLANKNESSGKNKKRKVQMYYIIDKTIENID